MVREPRFDNLLSILRREVPERPTLFEFFLNGPLYRKLIGEEKAAEIDVTTDGFAWLRYAIHGFRAAGYDYVTTHGSDFAFPIGHVDTKETRSLNEGALIRDRATFESYPWPDPDGFDYSRLHKLAAELPSGMKFIVFGPNGVLENVIQLVGYESLCYMVVDDPALVQDVFDAVGSRLVRYYEICGQYDSVGAMISNDDWGFKTQTMLSVDDMRKYVFPWHKRIVEAIHGCGRLAILHSCGKLDAVMDDVIDDMRFDGKHSFEDSIMPVEQAYEKWGARIAILGGIDVDFVCRATPEQVRQRSLDMLERAKSRGGYALGTGNSVPEDVPVDNYMAMISAVRQ